MWHRITDFFNVDYHKKYGEGTKFDLDYGKLLILLRVLESDVNCKDVEHFKFTEYVELEEVKE